MTMIDPEAVEAFLTCKVAACVALANRSAPKVADEIKATTSVDLSLFLRDWNPSITSNTGMAPSKMGRAVDLPREGKTQYAAVEIRYPYDMQALLTAPVNKAFNLLRRGVRLEFVVRKGIDIEVDWLSTQKAETWSVKCGRQNRVRSGDDDQAEWEISQMLFPYRQVVEDAVLAP